MQYHKTITLKNSVTCTLRNADFADGGAVLDVFLLTHRQTDFLLSYADENTFTAEDEAHYLKESPTVPTRLKSLQKSTERWWARRAFQKSDGITKCVTVQILASASTKNIGAWASARLSPPPASNVQRLRVTVSWNSNVSPKITQH